MEPSKLQFALYFLISALLIVFLSLGSIHLFKPEDKTREYAGIYYREVDHHVFISCNERESWWVSSDSFVDYDLQIKYESLIQPGQRFIFVRIRGEITQSGHYGYLGKSDREIIVKELINTQAVPPAGCFSENTN